MKTLKLANALRKGMTDQRGFGLIEVVMVSAIGVLVMTALSQMTVNQVKMNRRLEDKIEILAGKSLLQTAFMKPEHCSWQVQGNKINLQGVDHDNSSTTKINLGKKLFIGEDKKSFPIAIVGENFMQSRTSVKKISLENIRGSADTYLGDFVIRFDGTNFSPLVLTQTLDLTPDSSGKTGIINGCGNTTSTGAGSFADGLWPDIIICEDGDDREVLFYTNRYPASEPPYGYAQPNHRLYMGYSETLMTFDQDGNFAQCHAGSGGCPQNVNGFVGCNGKNIKDIPGVKFGGVWPNPKFK